MLFDIQDFFYSLKENQEKKEIYEKYNKLVENIDYIKSYKDLVIYKEYLKKFNTEKLVKKLKLSEYIVEDNFDWDFLLKLVFGSFSSDSDFIFDIKEENIKLFIKVESSNKKLKKYLDELWGFQIDRMYEIYMEEQMNLFILAKEDEEEKNIVDKQQKERFEYFKEIEKRFDVFLEYIDLKG